ncbi:hypothetical protein [Sodalis sp. RH23]|uniref:hypothetical protein n=1 Tax=unclassified Sodalis (in: enterobacteria) TaxID=2636512 RepID=UPI0039B47F3C
MENNLLGAIVGGAAESAAIAGAVGHGSQSESNDDDGFDMGGDICEGTREQCSVRDGTRGPGRMESRNEEGGEAKPNLGKDIAKAADAQKAELGGVGSGTPGGWGPEDEEKARNNDRKVITVEELRSTSSRGQETLGRSKLFERAGGKNAANKEFDALAPDNVKQIPGGRVGSLSDGRTVIIRERSTDGRPTLEIQSGRNRIKFRYEE